MSGLFSKVATMYVKSPSKTASRAQHLHAESCGCAVQGTAELVQGGLTWIVLGEEFLDECGTQVLESPHVYNRRGC